MQRHYKLLTMELCCQSGLQKACKLLHQTSHLLGGYLCLSQKAETSAAQNVLVQVQYAFVFSAHLTLQDVLVSTDRMQ